MCVMPERLNVNCKDTFPEVPHRYLRPLLGLRRVRAALTLPRNNDLRTPSRNPYIVHMSEMRFEWDDAKSRQNLRKHGVSFEEAQTVFMDENAVRFFDPDHSDDEDRFLMLGISFRLRVLVVCHCFRQSDSVIRIISARKADKGEESDYWNAR